MLKGKIAVVTGGTRGIGYAIVKKYLENGAKVILFGSRQETVDKALASLKEENPEWEVSGACPSLTDAKEVADEIQAIHRKYGKIDILVNNAGITKDMLLMRMTEILLSIPNLLLVIFLQAILGKANVLSLSLVIGVTSWTSIAKVVRTEVRQLRSNEYVVAARCMGGGFFYILRKHLAPNFLSSIMFMVVMNIRSAIVEESTLSFMGIGLPLEIISWGSMLSLSEKALLTDGWWIILIPGAFLVVTLLAITGIGDYLRKELNKKESYL